MKSETISVSNGRYKAFTLDNTRFRLTYTRRFIYEDHAQHQILSLIKTDPVLIQKRVDQVAVKETVTSE